MPVASNQWHIGLVGYGEVGRILAEDLRKNGVRVSAYDLKLGDDRAKPLRDHAAPTASRWRRRMPIWPRRPT